MACPSSFPSYSLTSLGSKKPGQVNFAQFETRIQFARAKVTQLRFYSNEEAHADDHVVWSSGNVRGTTFFLRGALAGSSGDIRDLASSALKSIEYQCAREGGGSVSSVAGWNSSSIVNLASSDCTHRDTAIRFGLLAKKVDGSVFLFVLSSSEKTAVSTLSQALATEAPATRR